MMNEYYPPPPSTLRSSRRDTAVVPPPGTPPAPVRVYSVRRADVLGALALLMVVTFCWTFSYHAARYAAHVFLGVQL